MKRENGAISIRVCEGRRVNGKSVQKLIKTIGQSKNPLEVAALERMAKDYIIFLQQNNPLHDKKKNKSRYGKIPDNFKVKDINHCRRVSEGVFDIFGHIYDGLGLKKLIKGTYRDSQWNDILKALVLARIAGPKSKRKTAWVLSKNYAINHPKEKYYRVMDRAIKFSQEARRLVLDETLKLHGGEINIILFDVTTLYFESIEKDDLKNFGFSKDGKCKEVQVVLSLMTTNHGHPVGYKLFPGNTSEGKTLIEHIQQTKKELSLKKVTLIADRAMFTEENLSKMESQGIDYIVACKLRKLPKEEREKTLSDKNYNLCTFGGELHWVNEREYKGRRLVVSYSSKRAKRDQELREKLIKKVLDKSKDGKVRAADFVGNKGTKKFLNVAGEKLKIDHKKIEEESRWDGIHGVITNNSHSSPTTLLSRYRELWKIEAAFRFNKHDLKMRPIYHWKEERIEAHILICYLAFAVGHFCTQRIKEYFKKELNETKGLSLAVCVEELSRVESSLVNNKGLDTNLYVIPTTLESRQQAIYDAIGIERPTGPYMLK